MVRGRLLSILTFLRLSRQIFVRDRKCRLPHEEKMATTETNDSIKPSPRCGNNGRSATLQGATHRWCRGTRRMRVRLLQEQNGEKPYNKVQTSHPHPSPSAPPSPSWGRLQNASAIVRSSLIYKTKFRKLPKNQRTNSQLHCVEQNIRVASNLLVRVISSPAPR